MKLNHLLSAACLTAGLATTGAQAETLNLTELLSYTDGGFRSSLIHDQSCGAMCGGTLAGFDSALTGGTFDTVTGDIGFSGSISSGTDSSTFEADGNLATSARPDGLFGSITFTFFGDLLDGLMLNFDFADESLTSGGEPNGVASNGTEDFIALWGDTGKYLTGDCGAYCYGMDLRIAYESDGGGGVGAVPLPASLGFLLAGLGGFGVTRKLRKKA